MHPKARCACWRADDERRVLALAFTAALNPKLLATDLLLIDNQRPRAMFLCLQYLRERHRVSRSHRAVTGRRHRQLGRRPMPTAWWLRPVSSAAQVGSTTLWCGTGFTSGPALRAARRPGS